MRSTHRAPTGRQASKGFAAAVLGVFLFGFAPAEAHSDCLAANCEVDHNRLSNSLRYENYGLADEFGWAVPNRSAVQYDRYAHHNRYNRRRRGSEVVFRNSIPARGRARIVVVEEIHYRRHGARRVCTVSTRGPDSDLVPHARLRRVARRQCSRRARIRIYG